MRFYLPITKSYLFFSGLSGPSHVYEWIKEDKKKLKSSSLSYFDMLFLYTIINSYIFLSLPGNM